MILIVLLPKIAQKKHSVLLLQGMIYLHNSDLGLHGNLRSSNCVVTSRWTLQVADFGLHELRFASETASGCENTLNYKLLWRAPELLRNMKEGGQGRGSQKGDVYSFGIILFEIYGRQGPYGDEMLEQVRSCCIVNNLTDIFILF